MVVLPTKEDRPISLHDIDKQSDTRANPKINADDSVANRMAHETNSTTYRTTGSGVNQGLVFQQGIVQSYDADNNRNVFFGYEPTINATRPVLRVAKDGYDAVTAEDDELVFNSENNIFKIVGTGVISETAATTAGNSTLSTYTHNLGYIPVVFAYFGAAGAEGIPLPSFSIDAGGNIDQWVRLSAVNTVDVTFAHYERTGSGGPFSYRFYLMQETSSVL